MWWAARSISCSAETFDDLEQLPYVPRRSIRGSCLREENANVTTVDVTLTSDHGRHTLSRLLNGEWVQNNESERADRLVEDHSFVSILLQGDSAETCMLWSETESFHYLFSEQ
jgi:hypothetical protein